MPTAITPSSSDPALACYVSPIGSITLAARGGALVGLWVDGQRFFGGTFGIDEAVAPSSGDGEDGVAAPRLLLITRSASYPQHVHRSVDISAHRNSRQLNE